MKYFCLTIMFCICLKCFPQKFTIGQFSNGTHGKEKQFLQFCDSSTFFFGSNINGLIIIGDIYGDTIIHIPPIEESNDYVGGISVNGDTVVLTKWLKPFIVFLMEDSLNFKVLSSLIDECKPGEYFHKNGVYFKRITRCGYPLTSYELKWYISINKTGEYYIKKVALNPDEGIAGEVIEEIMPLSIYK